MKKNSTLKMITGVLLIVALMTGTAFATAGQPSVPKTDTSKEVVVEDNGAKNNLVYGKVESIKTEEDYTTISITNDDMGMVFLANPKAFVIDQKTKNYLKLEEIKEGMMITAVINKDAPMTLSLPPQTSGAIGFIINDEAGGVNLSVFDEELLNFEKDLLIRISDETQIVNVTGDKRVYGEDDLKNAELLVFSTIMQPSMPAQTTPEFVMILNLAEQLTENGNEDSIENDSSNNESVEVQFVTLRDNIESKGFTVEWTSSDAPIVMTKDDQKIEITIGSDEFTFTHKTKDIKPLDNMEKLDAPAKLEEGKTMVPKTFIDAL